MLGRDYPGSNIGPEPTTDRFTVVHWDPEERRIPGNTLAVSPDKPYQVSGFACAAPESRQSVFVLQVESAGGVNAGKSSNLWAQVLVRRGLSPTIRLYSGVLAFYEAFIRWIWRSLASLQPCHCAGGRR